MRTFHQLLVIGISLLLAAVVTAQQPARKPAGAQPLSAKRVVARPPGFRPVATVQEIMAGMIDPASKVVFNAVSSTATEAGVE